MVPARIFCTHIPYKYYKAALFEKGTAPAFLSVPEFVFRLRKKEVRHKAKILAF